MAGWIKLHRQVLDNGWLKKHKIFIFWTYCLLKAVHKETKVIISSEEIELKPGQFIFGRKKAAKDLNLSEQEIRTCIKFLKRAGNITVKSTNHYSLISVVKWNFYQNEHLDYNQQNNQHLTSSQPSLNHIKKYKNNKIQKNEDNKDIFMESSIELRLSSLLLSLIRKRKPDFKEPNLQEWAREIDLMIRIDNRSPERIEQVIMWCQEAPFWQNHILSTSKLREHFDKLEMIMEGEKERKDEYI